MSAKIRYTNEPLGKLQAQRRFFKREAAKHNTQYQRVIQRLLDAYAERYGRPQTGRSTRTRVRRAG